MTTIWVDGRPIEAPPGATVAAALVAAGSYGWRTTRRGERPRGLFCGIGACHDCLLTVDGTANLRACLVAGDTGDESDHRLRGGAA